MASLIPRGRSGRRLLLTVLLPLGMGACAPTMHIGDLLAQPQRYDGRTVQVKGTVTRSAGLFGTGAYQIEDGTGSIYVIAQGSGVPQQGSKTKAKGRFQSVFNFSGRTIAAIVQGND